MQGKNTYNEHEIKYGVNVKNMAGGGREIYCSIKMNDRDTVGVNRKGEEKSACLEG